VEVRIVEERYTVAVADGGLALVLHRPDSAAAVPCVVACHGLSASKDSDKYLLLAAEFPPAGLALARFDFRGCGESSGVEEETTVASRIADVEAVLATLASHPGLDGRIGLLGSSMGGFVALHVASRRPEAAPVVTWNAPANLAELANGDAGEVSGVGVPFAIEYMSGVHALAPKGVPRHLVIQADGDEVVSLEHGVLLHAQATEPCDLIVIAGGDHRLSDMAHRRQAIAHSLAWFRRFLG
jgi:pimeloyl-ACP methyl ester carboxylesterase